MSIENFIKVYPVIKDPRIISKCIRFLSKKFKDKRFQDGALWAGDKTFQDKEVRDVQILPLVNTSESMSEVHWCNFLSHFVLEGLRQYAAEFPDIRQATVIDIQGLRYEKGGHYKFHVDDGPGMNRKYSAILMLNNDYEGGELCFKLEDKELKITNKP